MNHWTKQKSKAKKYSQLLERKRRKLIRRLKKYKHTLLFFIHYFDIPCENNFIKRCLRMIIGKAKTSG